MPSTVTDATKTIASSWFTNLEQGNFNAAMELLDPNIHWENIPPTPGVSDLAPWLGTYTGVAAVKDSFGVWASHSAMLSFKLLKLIVEEENALGIVHEHAKCLANNNEYDLYVATSLEIKNEKIAKWQVYWDISPLISAYRDL